MVSQSDTFSYREWAKRAEAFCASLAGKDGLQFSEEFAAVPPLSATELTALCKELPQEFPACITEFITSASAGVRFRYHWDLSGMPAEQLEPTALDEDEIYGRTGLCVAASLVEWTKDCKAWAAETWIADDPEQQAIWLNSFPIAALENGDFLAVTLDGGANPPVVYLSHDDESVVIAPSFTSFLETWERLCYLGPELWMLDSFIDSETGFLNAETEEAAALRRLFA